MLSTLITISYNEEYKQWVTEAQQGQIRQIKNDKATKMSLPRQNNKLSRCVN